MSYTLAHVTHEAVEKIGGIGTVLEGLITSPVYQKHVGRTILIGPCGTHMLTDPSLHLGPDGDVLYSTVDKIDRHRLGAKLRPIEWAFNVSLIYGTRRFDLPGEGRTGEAEVLLIDVFNINGKRVELFKHRLAETFGIESFRYEGAWDYEEYVRLAEPAFYALSALLKAEELPCILFAHEFMGLPAAFKAVLDGQDEFRTVFHAHECATARYLVEHHPGHDTAFYNVMHAARDQGLYVGDVFGDLSWYFRHAIIRQSHVCDAIVAVGDYTAEEIHFLDSHFDHHHIDMVYNGLPVMQVTGAEKEASRKMLADYTEALLGWRPDVLMTHVTRPVISKGLWRDLTVCDHLDRHFERQGLRGVLIMLTTGGGVRRPQDVRIMESEYGWPLNHREGYPDLVGPEVDIHAMIEAFNANHQNIRVVLVNQFGFTRQRIGDRLAEGMDMAVFRWAADVEFGQATYEPFGISPLEPLGCGAVCVITNVCGCKGFVDFATGGVPTPNVVEADYTQLDEGWDLKDVEKLKTIDAQTRTAIEQRIASEVADQIMKRLPLTADERKKMIDSGQKLVAKMGWDQVLGQKLIPVLQRVVDSGVAV